MKDSNSEAKSDVISGRNPVSEAIRSGRPIDKILVARGEKSGAVVGILAKARDRQIPVKEVDRAKLDYITGSSVHQGIAAFAAVKDYSSVDEIFEYAESRGESPFIVVLDEIEDPHNLGAIIRTAECAGVHGVIIPKRRSAGLSYVVGKASAGAVESGACAIVIGNEGKGISRLVRQKCDVIVSLPMKGKINSLNASVAAGILMYHAAKGR